jgi:hypothetical protein
MAPIVSQTCAETVETQVADAAKKNCSKFTVRLRWTMCVTPSLSTSCAVLTSCASASTSQLSSVGAMSTTATTFSPSVSRASEELVRCSLAA